MAGSTTTGQLGGLKKPRRGDGEKFPKKTRGILESKLSKGKPVGTGGGGSGGGVAGVWNETTRSYYETFKELRSSDGALVILYQNIASIAFDSGVTLKFKNE
jgi:hypothetical protein